MSDEIRWIKVGPDFSVGANRDFTYLFGLFGKSGRGDFSGLQRKPGWTILSPLGSARPSLTSCP